MAELTPPGYDNMVGFLLSLFLCINPCRQFFGLFGLSNRASSMIGPSVIQAIIGGGDNWKGFPFLFALSLGASLMIWFFVNIQKGRRDAVAWAEQAKADVDGDGKESPAIREKGE
jgi:MFS-type transporter involved in bile tolerance (Atg22 family)